MDDILYGISWSNLSMLLASIPSGEEEEETVEADEEVVMVDSLEELAAFLNM